MAVNVSKYSKAVVAVGAVVAVVVQAVADGAVDAQEVGLIATAVAAAVGVFYVKNSPA
jgi:hypothetical protein